MTARVLVIDDDPDVRSQLRKEFEGPQTAWHVTATGDFDEGTRLLADCTFNAVVIDLSDETLGAVDPERGNRVVADIRKSQFLPVVVYTAYPDRVKPDERGFIRVVDKHHYNAETVREKVSEQLASDLIRVASEMAKVVRDTIRHYYWDTLAAEHVLRRVTPKEAVYSAVRRIAWELSGERAAQVLSTVLGEEIKPDHVDPAQAYLWPPILPPANLPVWTGDVLALDDGEEAESYGVVITPACDLMAKKAPVIVVVRAISVARAVKERATNGGQIRKNNIAQYYRFPPAYGIPELCLDFARLLHLTRADSEKLARMATLDDPWVHEVRARVQAYFGRVGTPDYHD